MEGVREKGDSSKPPLVTGLLAPFYKPKYTLQLELYFGYGPACSILQTEIYTAVRIVLYLQVRLMTGLLEVVVSLKSFPPCHSLWLEVSSVLS